MSVSTTRHRTAVALAFAGTLALTGCSGSTNSTSAAGPVALAPDAPSGGAPARAGQAPAPGAVDSAVAPAAPAAPAKDAKAASPPLVAGQKLARVASLSVAVGDIRTAAAQARAAANVAGGLVLQEDLSSTSEPAPVRSPAPGIPERRRGSASLTIQVPSDKLDATIERLSALGTVTARGAGSEDVTAAHVDTQSRIRTLQASLDRVRALMAKATTLDQVVALEREVTTRQSDLEALQAQLAALNQRVDTATITLVLMPQQAGNPDDSATDSGIGTAFTKGWQAFVTAAIWVVSALAAVLPFALAGALLWWVGRLFWRARTTRTGRPVDVDSSVNDESAPPAADRTPAGSGPRSR